ncbi:unnamed protein product, partial [Mesorhabditis spiculigera]
MRFSLQSLIFALVAVLALFSSAASSQEFSPKELQLLQILSRNRRLASDATEGRWKRGDLERFRTSMEILNRNRCFFNPISC